MPHSFPAQDLPAPLAPAGLNGEDGAPGKDGKDADWEPTFEIEVITDASKIQARTVAVKTLSQDDGTSVVEVEKMQLFFLNGKSDIPYLFIKNGSDNILSSTYEDGGSKDFTFSEIELGTKTVTITNTKRSTAAIFNLEKRKLQFTDLDEFFQASDSYWDITNSSRLDFIDMTSSGNIAGAPVSLSWAYNDIGLALVQYKGTYHLALPLQFFNDVFVSSMGATFLYNGTNVYMQLEGALKEDFYNTKNVPSGGLRSQALAEFCYNELCVNLDLNYGLGKLHGISGDYLSSFSNYLVQIGMSPTLHDRSGLAFANGIHDLTFYYFNDGHSGYNLNSPYIPSETKINGTKTSSWQVSYSENTERYKFARRAKFSGNYSTDPELSQYCEALLPAPCYEESGDTAIVRFDTFLVAGGMDIATRKLLTLSEDNAKIYAGMEEYVPLGTVGTSNAMFDTISFLHYVNEKIKANASIENVVLDISCNSGGMASALACAASWMLGKADFAITNSISGAKIYTSYQADIDFDGTFGDEDDSIKDKNLFCLISPVSFSCGNALPAMLKESGRVTLLGVTSAGGAAVVQPSSCADGTMFQVSSKYVISVEKNGSNYDVDRGVEPHYYINKPENFYDIETIKTIVGNINSGAI